MKKQIKSDCIGFKQRQEQEDSNIYLISIMNALRPILSLSKLMGLCRFSHRINELLPANRKTKCVVIGLAGVYVGAFTIYVFTNTPYASDYPMLGIFETVLSVLIVIYYPVTLIIHSVTKSYVNVEIITLFVGIDSKLHFNTRYNFYIRSRSYAICIVLCVLIFNLSFLVLYHFDNIFDIFNFCTLQIIGILQDLETIVICVKVYMLKIRLIAVNHKLKKLIEMGQN